MTIGEFYISSGIVGLAFLTEKKVDQAISFF